MKAVEFFLQLNRTTFYDTDAIVFITGTAGRFGSGGVPVLIQLLKERHIGKPLYAFVIMPFEEEVQNQYAIYNTALCLKSLQKVADAIFYLIMKNLNFQGKYRPLMTKKLLTK